MGEWRSSSTILDLCPGWKWVGLSPRPQERAPSTLWIGVWVGLRSRLGATENRKILLMQRTNYKFRRYVISLTHQLLDISPFGSQTRPVCCQFNVTTNAPLNCVLYWVPASCWEPTYAYLQIINNKMSETWNQCLSCSNLVQGRAFIELLA
jgi:hypothetical protein